MKLRFVSVCLGTPLLGAVANAQLLSNVTTNEFTYMHDHAEYVDAGGQLNSVRDFTRSDFEGLNTLAIVATTDVVGFPNVSGEIGGNYGSLVGNTLSNQADSAHIHVRSEVNTAFFNSIVSAGPNRNVHAEQFATGWQDFYFSLTSAANGSFNVSSQVYGTRGSYQISLIDLTTNTIVAANINAPSGNYATPVNLAPGNYRLYSQMTSDVIFNRGEQGTIDMLGTEGWIGTYDLTLNPASAPVPEPASLAALGFGAVALLRRRKR